MRIYVDFLQFTGRRLTPVRDHSFGVFRRPQAKLTIRLVVIFDLSVSSLCKPKALRCGDHLLHLINVVHSIARRNQQPYYSIKMLQIFETCFKYDQAYCVVTHFTRTDVCSGLSMTPICNLNLKRVKFKRNVNTR